MQLRNKLIVDLKERPSSKAKPTIATHWVMDDDLIQFLDELIHPGVVWLPSNGLLKEGDIVSTFLL